MYKSIKNIKIDSIKPNKYQPRTIFNEEDLNELAISIKEYGIIQPITVREDDENFEIIAGERRWRAAKKVGLEVVPCIVNNVDTKTSAEITLLENLQREDLSFIEEAEAYNRLINDYKLTQEKIAIKMGKKQSTIANKLRILKLSKLVRKNVIEKNLTERHARALLLLPTEQIQLDVINKIVKSNLNVKKTEELITRELLKIAGNNLSSKNEKKIKASFPTKIYVNSIKQIFDKFKIPAKYDSKDLGDAVEITIRIPKDKK